MTNNSYQYLFNISQRLMLLNKIIINFNAQIYSLLLKMIDECCTTECPMPRYNSLLSHLTANTHI